MALFPTAVRPCRVSSAPSMYRAPPPRPLDVLFTKTESTTTTLAPAWADSAPPANEDSHPVRLVAKSMAFTVAPETRMAPPSPCDTQLSKAER